MGDFSPLVHVEVRLLSEQTSHVQNPQEVFERKGMNLAIFQKVKKERQDSEDFEQEVQTPSDSPPITPVKKEKEKVGPESLLTQSRNYPFQSD